MDRFEHRVVVKIGTNTLTGGGLEPDQAYLDSIADQVVELQARGYEVLLVSSGAIGCGMGVMDRTERVREVRLRQALAAIGQPRMVAGWERAFSRHGVHVAQLLLTYDALRDRSSFLNLRNATE
ncbi:MAG: glutamate 5-kinase, partial [Candidatus Thermoplasmatota archaeon]|nr:glutamate 5-kinase [Candidatus Thermoplasmatota archaeon]